jgi:hypothetical protein
MWVHVLQSLFGRVQFIVDDDEWFATRISFGRTSARKRDEKNQAQIEKSEHMFDSDVFQLLKVTRTKHERLFETKRAHNQIDRKILETKCRDSKVEERC